MLDYRVDTFLAVCKHNSYTKAAEELCITQPGVSQHIQYLEKEYRCRLFEYNNRQLKLTEAGEIFHQYALNAKVNDRSIREKMVGAGEGQRALRFAATLTIGEFTLAPILTRFMDALKGYSITMYVENTEEVLKMLQEGRVHFALVEGLFNKSGYQTRLFKNANYILVSPVDHPLAMKERVHLEDLMEETMIVREQGSGSREILERALMDKNVTLQDFARIIEIGNVSVIKQLVKSGLGLSFMYKDAAREEIRRGELAEIPVADFIIQREFNFIYLKDSIIQEELEGIRKTLKKIYRENNL